MDSTYPSYKTLGNLVFLYSYKLNKRKFYTFTSFGNFDRAYLARTYIINYNTCSSSCCYISFKKNSNQKTNYFLSPINFMFSLNINQKRDYFFKRFNSYLFLDFGEHCLFFNFIFTNF